MTPIKQDIIELVITNPHELHMGDLKELLADKYSASDVTFAALDLHLDDRILGIGIDWTFYIYDKPPPYCGEG